MVLARNRIGDALFSDTVNVHTKGQSQSLAVSHDLKLNATVAFPLSVTERFLLQPLVCETVFHRTSLLPLPLHLFSS